MRIAEPTKKWLNNIVLDQPPNWIGPGRKETKEMLEDLPKLRMLCLLETLRCTVGAVNLHGIKVAFC